MFVERDRVLCKKTDEPIKMRFDESTTFDGCTKLAPPGEYDGSIYMVEAMWAVATISNVLRCMDCRRGYRDLSSTARLSLFCL